MTGGQVVTVEIIQVREEADLADVRRLAWEFVDWLMERYPDDREKIEGYLKAQNFAAILENLLDYYGPPTGDCLLARVDGDAAGIVMFKRRDDHDCEMNRMFVRASARGHGVGEAIGHRLIELAGAAGYKRMILVAAPKHREAIPLYEKLGFIHDQNLPDTGGGDLEVRMRLDL